MLPCAAASLKAFNQISSNQTCLIILVVRGTLLPCAANRSILLSTEQKSTCVNKGVEFYFYQAYDTLEDSEELSNREPNY